MADGQMYKSILAVDVRWREELGSWMDAALHWLCPGSQCDPVRSSLTVGKGQANFTPRSPEESISGRLAGWPDA